MYHMLINFIFLFSLSWTKYLFLLCINTTFHYMCSLYPVCDWFSAFSDLFHRVVFNFLPFFHRLTRFSHFNFHHFEFNFAIQRTEDKYSNTICLFFSILFLFELGWMEKTKRPPLYLHLVRFLVNWKRFANSFCVFLLFSVVMKMSMCHWIDFHKFFC